MIHDDLNIKKPASKTLVMCSAERARLLCVPLRPFFVATTNPVPKVLGYTHVEDGTQCPNDDDQVDDDKDDQKNTL